MGNKKGLMTVSAAKENIEDTGRNGQRKTVVHVEETVQTKASTSVRALFTDVGTDDEAATVPQDEPYGSLICHVLAVAFFYTLLGFGLISFIYPVRLAVLHAPRSSMLHGLVGSVFCGVMMVRCGIFFVNARAKVSLVGLTITGFLGQTVAMAGSILAGMVTVPALQSLSHEDGDGLSFLLLLTLWSGAVFSAGAFCNFLICSESSALGDPASPPCDDDYVIAVSVTWRQRFLAATVALVINTVLVFFMNSFDYIGYLLPVWIKFVPNPEVYGVDFHTIICGVFPFIYYEIRKVIAQKTHGHTSIFSEDGSVERFCTSVFEYSIRCEMMGKLAAYHRRSFHRVVHALIIQGILEVLMRTTDLLRVRAQVHLATQVQSYFAVDESLEKGTSRRRRSSTLIRLENQQAEEEIEEQLARKVLEADVKMACEYLAHMGAAVTLWTCFRGEVEHLCVTITIGLGMEFVTDTTTFFAKKQVGFNTQLVYVTPKTAPLLVFYFCMAAQSANQAMNCIAGKWHLSTWE